MIIEKIVMSDLQEVQELEKTERGQKGFGSTNEDSRRNKISEEKPLEIAFISAESFGRMYRQGNTTGILRWDKEGATISATTISTELALRKQKKGTCQDLRDMVPREYHEFLSLFEEKERKDLPLHRHTDHRIDLEQGEAAPFMKLYPLREGELKSLREYLENIIQQRWIRPSSSSAGVP